MLVPGKTLTDEQFAAWFGAIEPADKSDFFYANGGSPDLARFVCALDLLLVAGARRGARRGTEIEAYAMAYGCSLEEAKRKYRDALNHDAVAGLLDRLSIRERILAWLGIESHYTRLVHGLLEQANDWVEDGHDLTKNEVALVSAALKGASDLQKGIKIEQIEERIERSKKGAENGRAAALAAISIDGEGAKGLLEWLKSKVGPDFDKLVASIGEGSPEGPRV
jgi:hypothetical protein